MHIMRTIHVFKKTTNQDTAIERLQQRDGVKMTFGRACSFAMLWWSGSVLFEAALLTEHFFHFKVAFRRIWVLTRTLRLKVVARDNLKGEQFFGQLFCLL